MISARRRKNTVRESRMEMHRVTWCDVVIVTMGATMVTVMTMKLTFSPESAGR